LRESNLILDRRDGWNIFYRVVNPEIYSVLDAAQKFVGIEPNSYHASSVNCDCPHCLEKKTEN